MDRFLQLYGNDTVNIFIDSDEPPQPSNQADAATADPRKARPPEPIGPPPWKRAANQVVIQNIFLAIVLSLHILQINLMS
jgi:hypothetical protein